MRSGDFEFIKHSLSKVKQPSEHIDSILNLIYSVKLIFLYTNYGFCRKSTNTKYLNTLSRVDQCYQHAYSGKGVPTSDCEETEEEKGDAHNKDILTIITFLKAKILDAKELCLCERQRECKCKNDCNCDNDNFFEIIDRKFEWMTDNTVLITLRVNENVKLSKKMNLRIFSLDDKDDEVTIFDVVRVIVKKKLKSEHVHLLEENITIPLMEGFKMRDGEIMLRMSYMLYE